MALTPSNMMAIGTTAPRFTLPDVVSNQNISFNESSQSKATVVMFICNHCPYVKHIHEDIGKLANDYQSKEITFLAISSNDAENYPADAPQKMKELAEKLNYTFPYLYDETQEVAKAYQAACTPDFYIFDQNRKCVYRGQFDDSRPGNGIPVTGNDLREALDAILDGNPVTEKQKPSLGCNIKWKS